MPWPWRRRRSFFDELFGNIDEEIERMRERMNRMVREAGKIRGEGEFRVEGPYVYGFSMRVGPDGKPVFREFGNVQPRLKARGKVVEEAREPLVDVIEGDRETTVVAEVPGVEREDIKLDANENELKIDVETAERKYHKTISFKNPVRPETAKATYKNGVLEVRLERRAPAKEKSTRIPIE